VTKPIYEGKAKQLFETETPFVLRQVFKDDATAFNAEKKDAFAGKGALNTAISTSLLRIVEADGVPTHLLEQTTPHEQRVRKVDIIPLEVVVRFVVAGSLHRRTGLAEGTPVDSPLIEFYYKRDDLGDPLLNRAHIQLLGVAPPQTVDTLATLAQRAAQALRAHLHAHDLTLVDLKFEFGTDAETGDLLLADEISPDTMRIWNAAGEKLDKDRFRFDLGDLLAGYRQVAGKLGIDVEDR